MDFITDLPPSKRRGCVYDTILVIVDRYTKMVRYLPTQKTINAVNLAELFFEEIILRYGCPDGIVSDRGSVFTSGFWTEICYQSKMKRNLSTAFHPQTNSQTERQNQTLEHYLRTYCDEQQSNWASLLPLAEFVYHQAQQASSGKSPFYLMYGYEPELEIRAGDDAREEEVPAAKDRIEQLHRMRDMLTKRWATARESQARYYNQHHKPRVFNKGDLVLLLTKNLKLKRPSKKMSHKWIGPFRIDEPIGKQAYRLILPAGYLIHPVFYVSLLEPYKRRPDDESIPKL